MEKVITLSQLRQHGACWGQRKLFERLFGEEVTVSEEVALKHAGMFDWEWAACELLSYERRVLWLGAVSAAEDKWHEAHAASYNARQKALEAAEEARRHPQDLTLSYSQRQDAYEKALNVAFNTRQAIMNAASQERAKVYAVAFVRLYLSE